MSIFKNLGIKLFNKESEEIVEENDNNDIINNNTDSHIEFVNYRKISILKLYFLKKFCLHDWYQYSRMKTNVDENGIPEYITDTLICRKCGNITKIKL